MNQGNQTYTCTGIEHGYDYEYGVSTDFGEIVFDNNTTEIITCDGGAGTIKRLIARLK